MLLQENKKNFNHEELEKRLFFMKTNENFIKHEWEHSDHYVCYYTHKEKDSISMGSISIFHWIFNTLGIDWYYTEENEDKKIIYKNIKDTTNWFQTLYQETVNGFAKAVEEAFSESIYNQKDWDKYYGSEIKNRLFLQFNYDESGLCFNK